MVKKLRLIIFSIVFREKKKIMYKQIQFSCIHIVNRITASDVAEHFMPIGMACM